MPFNPSLLEQVSFYSKRLRQEESIRRLGFGFMALAMFIQVFAVVVPPQKSLAYSADYIAPNGFTSNKSSVLAAWDNPNSDIKAIYSRFGVTRDMIVNLSSSLVRVNSASGNLWSTGRSSLSAVSRSGSIKQQYKDSEFSVQAGTTTIYVRELKAWDIINSSNTYYAFEGTKADGSKFWLLKDCGNYTQVGKPLQPTVTPATPTITPTTVVPTTPAVTPTTVVTVTPVPIAQPALELRKTLDGVNSTLKPGDEFSYRFEYRNSVVGSMNAENVVLTDIFDLSYYRIVSATNSFTMNGNVGTLRIGTVGYTNDFKTASVVRVKLRDDVPNGQSVCNTASLSASNATTVTSGGSNLCVSVLTPCPVGSVSATTTDSRCSTPILVCSLTQSTFNRTTRESTLVTSVTSSNSQLTKISSYSYNFGDASAKTVVSSALTDTAKHVYKDGTYTATATVNYTAGSDTKTIRSTTCATAVEAKPDAPLASTKTAENITQKLSNADTLKKKANGGDVILYTLTTRNSTSYDRTNYTITDKIGDILDYADVDLTFLAKSGGRYDSDTKTVIWANQTVKAGKDLAVTFRVTIKNPVPATNQPSTLSTSFDCVISNAYGSEVSIPINCPLVKSAEYLTTTLPNTGPGTSVAIGVTFTVFIGYFFARSRLLGKELELIRIEYLRGGGF